LPTQKLKLSAHRRRRRGQFGDTPQRLAAERTVSLRDSQSAAKPGHDIVVMGASAGGLEVVAQIVENLPSDLPAALFVVIHTGPDTPGVLPQILMRRGKLPARHAMDGEKLQHGVIYCAPPDQHLLLEDGHVQVLQGPRENGFRPAIDPLFRTAATAYATRVVGVILSGALDDGVHGLLRIKERGGVTIVQNPEEAIVDVLPLNAIKYVEVDHIADAKEIAGLLVRLADQPAPREVAPMSEDEVIEATVADGVHHILNSRKAGQAPSAFTCPDCGGSLWEMQNGKLVRYRCHVGHVYTADSLLMEKDGSLENVLWTALRALEESIALRYRMAERAKEGRISTIAERYERRAQEDEARARILRQFLLPEEEKTVRSGKNGREGKSAPSKRKGASTARNRKSNR
jgi:two-component system chemotaxis response regulator CheB